MTTLTLEIQSDLWQRLQAKATQRREPLEKVVLAILDANVEAEGEVETPEYSPVFYEETEGAKVDRVIRESGMLSGLGPYMQGLIKTIPANEEAVIAALERVGGTPLSEIVSEQRGPKE